LNLKRLNPEESFKLMQEEGYTYLDVRTPEEFSAGHPEGSYNIPWALRDPATAQMTPNADFLSVVEATFPKDARLLLGCRSGGRSTSAANVMFSAGYTDLVENYAGWVAHKDGTQGWASTDLPAGEGTPEERSYETLKKNVS
jgi:rhodanese-related sulfurtransferase